MKTKQLFSGLSERPKHHSIGNETQHELFSIQSKSLQPKEVDPLYQLITASILIIC